MNMKALFILPFIVTAVHASQLDITPKNFDFGWCPDNAKIDCEFTLTNTSQSMIPITSIEPACGCTAAEFSPEQLSSQEETTVLLTFNTRGYNQARFNKLTRIKTEDSDDNYHVRLKGQVARNDVPVRPEGNGIAEFKPGSKAKKQKIKILNTTPVEVPLSIVQKPKSWAQVELSEEKIAPGKSADLYVMVDGPYDQVKTTSVTFEAKENETSHRFTVAIRTGAPPTPYKRRIRLPRAP